MKELRIKDCMFARQQRAEIAQISAGLCCRTALPAHPNRD